MISPYHFTYGVLSEAVPGEEDCGDQWLIKELPDAILVAVADGLGHGKEAAEASKAAMAVLEKTEPEQELLDIIQHCHTELQSTRGVVLGLAKIQKNYQVSWVGVGNIMGLHWSSPLMEAQSEGLYSQGGVVGYLLPHLRPFQFKVEPGHALIMATDGLTNQLMDEKPFYNQSAQEIADVLFQKYHHKKDDALILVIRWENNFE